MQRHIQSRPPCGLDPLFVSQYGVLQGCRFKQEIMHVSHLHQPLESTVCAEDRQSASLDHGQLAKSGQDQCTGFQLLQQLVWVGSRRVVSELTMPGTAKTNVRECSANLHLLAHKEWVERIWPGLSPLLILCLEFCMHSSRAVALSKTKY